jgi:sulfite dehydrogenase
VSPARALPAAALAAAVVAGALLGARGGGEAAAPPPQTTPAPTVVATATPAAEEPQSARALFAQACGACHTLRRGGGHGIVGPDLDALRPSQVRVERAIRTGSIDGVMQPGLLTGADARRVARYVARTAGD